MFSTTCLEIRDEGIIWNRVPHRPLDTKKPHIYARGDFIFFMCVLYKTYLLAYHDRSMNATEYNDKVDFTMNIHSRLILRRKN